MIDAYLVWSHEHSAWWGEPSGYTKSMTAARRFSRKDAINVCFNAMPGTSTQLGALPELPVRESDLRLMIDAYDAAFPRNGEVWR